MHNEDQPRDNQPRIERIPFHADPARVETGYDGTPADRRVAQRVSIERNVKVFHPRSNRFIPARTLNVSDSGFLLEIDGPRPMLVGEELQIVIAWDRPTLVRREDLARVRIVRLDPASRVAVTKIDAAAQPALLEPAAA